MPFGSFLSAVRSSVQVETSYNLDGTERRTATFAEVDGGQRPSRLHGSRRGNGQHPRDADPHSWHPWLMTNFGKEGITDVAQETDTVAVGYRPALSTRSDQFFFRLSPRQIAGGSILILPATRTGCNDAEAAANLRQQRCRSSGSNLHLKWNETRWNAAPPPKGRRGLCPFSTIESPPHSESKRKTGSSSSRCSVVVARSFRDLRSWYVRQTTMR